MVNNASSDHSKEPQTAMERISTRIGKVTGEPQHNYILAALLVALLMAPLWGSLWRPILFLLVFMSATWLQMALTNSAGGSVHHAVLLWPAPQFVIALAVTALSHRVGCWGRILLAVVLAFFAARTSC